MRAALFLLCLSEFFRLPLGPGTTCQSPGTFNLIVYIAFLYTLALPFAVLDARVISIFCSHTISLQFETPPWEHRISCLWEVATLHPVPPYRTTPRSPLPLFAG